MWKIIETTLGLPPIGDVDDTAKVAVGTRAKAYHETYGVVEFVYLKGVASTVQYSWVTFNQDDSSTALLAANAIGPVAIASGAIVANKFGWYALYGKFPGRCLTGFADGANVYATATAGSVDDAIVAGDRVKNAKGASAIGTPAANQAEFAIQYPIVDDALAA